MKKSDDDESSNYNSEMDSASLTPIEDEYDED